ncbi:hypothetical protein CDL15_Pgr026285 [Punica granatum]|uniref:Uncharacterized protein n=1 Tax=Punica granatum TaxID=22663 RepID=A0A218XXW4_PUNGR|nr:hypothetical protein CDL15_Pgr026285 [Punica granatum]
MLALLLKRLYFVGDRLCCLGDHALTCRKFAENRGLVMRDSSSREERLCTPLSKGSEGYLCVEPLPRQSIREKARKEFSERREPVNHSSPMADVSL